MDEAIMQKEQETQRHKYMHEQRAAHQQLVMRVATLDMKTKIAGMFVVDIFDRC